MPLTLKFSPPTAPGFRALAAAASMLLLAPASPVFAGERAACADEGRVLKLGFYAFFRPISYSAGEDPKSPAFNEHRGYEADLLSALEAMKGAGLSFARRGIGAWKNIWLRPAAGEYDLVGGGITILESRTRDAAGGKAVVFTSGHVAFRQSLLARAKDAGRFASHKDLGSDARVGVLAGTTGEARLLRLTGLTDAAGVLAAGARVQTPRGEVVADGSANFVITSGRASRSLAARRSIAPPAETMPRVVYLGAESGEAELLAALRERRVDAVARGEIGNRDAAHASGGAFAVTALDPASEYGGFSLAAKDAGLAACISEKIDWLTDGRRIGYREWRADASVFMRRARAWEGGK